MTGLVCLQGGAEFGPGCREMDAALLRRAAGPVVVTALAGAVGREYRTASENGVRHFRALGAQDVVAAPDAREDLGADLAAGAAAPDWGSLADGLLGTLVEVAASQGREIARLSARLAEIEGRLGSS